MEDCAKTVCSATDKELRAELDKREKNRAENAKLIPGMLDEITRLHSEGQIDKVIRTTTRREIQGKYPVIYMVFTNITQEMLEEMGCNSQPSCSSRLP